LFDVTVVVDAERRVDEEVVGDDGVVIERGGIADLKRGFEEGVSSDDNVAGWLSSANEEMLTGSFLDGEEGDVVVDDEAVDAGIFASVGLDSGGVISEEDVVGEVLSAGVVLSINSGAVVAVGANGSDVVNEATGEGGVGGGSPEADAIGHGVDDEVEEQAIRSTENVESALGQVDWAINAEPTGGDPAIPCRSFGDGDFEVAKTEVAGT
jgi:hypothetical protein